MRVLFITLMQLNQNSARKGLIDSSLKSEI